MRCNVFSLRRCGVEDVQVYVVLKDVPLLWWGILKFRTGGLSVENACATFTSSVLALLGINTFSTNGSSDG